MQKKTEMALVGPEVGGFRIFFHHINPQAYT